MSREGGGGGGGGGGSGGGVGVRINSRILKPGQPRLSYQTKLDTASYI